MNARNYNIPLNTTMKVMRKLLKIIPLLVCRIYMIIVLNSCKEHVAPANVMIINVKAGFADTVIDPSLKTWFMVSDLKGNVIGIQRATTDQQQLEFTYDDSVHDESVYLTRMTLSASSGNIVCAGFSFLVPRKSQFTFAPSDPISIVGASTVTVTNVTTNPYSYLFTLGAGNNGLSTFAGNTLLLELGHIKNPDNLFIAILQSKGGTPYFKWIKGVEVHKQYHTDFTTFEAMSTHQVSLPANDGAGYTLSGSETGKDIHPISYALVDGDHSVATVYSPDTGFSQYILNLKFYKGENQFEVSTSTKTIPTSIDAPDFDLSVVEGKERPDNFALATQGNYDYAITYFGNSEGNFGWVVYNPANTLITGVVPQVPVEITQLFPSAKRSDLTLTRVSVFDDGALNGYNDLIKNLGTSSLPPNVFRSLTKSIQ